MLRRIAISLVSFVAITGALVACTGGGGVLGPDNPVTEPPPPTFEQGQNDSERTGTSGERAPNSTEGSSANTEGAPGAQGNGGAGAPITSDCGGTFSCTQINSNGQPETSTISLTSSNGSCAVDIPDNTDNVTITFESDGRITVNGSDVGSWSTTGTTLTISASGQSVTCVRTNATTPSPSSGSQDSSSNSGSGSSSNSSSGSSGK